MIYLAVPIITAWNLKQIGWKSKQVSFKFTHNSIFIIVTSNIQTEWVGTPVKADMVVPRNLAIIICVLMLRYQGLCYILVFKRREKKNPGNQSSTVGVTNKSLTLQGEL